MKKVILLCGLVLPGYVFSMSLQWCMIKNSCKTPISIHYKNKGRVIGHREIPSGDSIWDDLFIPISHVAVKQPSEMFSLKPNFLLIPVVGLRTSLIIRSKSENERDDQKMNRQDDDGGLHFERTYFIRT